MIKGVGIDIIEVQRVLEKISKPNGFREKIFSEEEITFCESNAVPGECYAARFAAKEAFLKATGFGLLLGHDLADIVVLNDAAGKPSIALRGSFINEAIRNDWNKIHLSLSHLEAIACAVVIIEQ
ncbi:MAG: holo-ACP synthase [Chryseolinea sp.]